MASQGRWKACTFVFVALAVCLAVCLTVVTILKAKEVKDLLVEQCTEGLATRGMINPDKPPIFSDLTSKEMRAIVRYVLNQKDLNVVEPTKVANLNESYISNMELLPPDKNDAVDYLEGRGEQPLRRAKVVIFRGDKRKPDVEEYIVGPLPNPAQHSLLRTVPFAFRAGSAIEEKVLPLHVVPMIERDLGRIMRESFGASLTNCGSRCLTVYVLTPMSTAISQKEERVVWLWVSYDVEFVSLHPVDLNILVNITGNDPSKFSINKIWYAGQLFESLTEFVDRYFTDPNIIKLKLTYPREDENLFSTLNLRGTTFPTTGQRRPYQTEPDGKRYSVTGPEVEYMGWKFTFRMSTVSGPQYYNIRYNGERIVYELSLQELAVVYSGYNPAQRFADYFDSYGMYGKLVRTLVPGADCPEHAHMISAHHYGETTGDATSLSKNAFCIFEQNTGIPLRRHHSYSKMGGKFYGGMMDDVLVFRTILTVLNYDYLFDLVLHQNGAIEMRVISTGYIMGTYPTSEEKPYGAHVHEHVNGNMHQHLFNFRVDVDIKGTKNRYETLDIESSRFSNRMWGPERHYFQTSYHRNLKSNEKQAAYKYNFDTPKYLLFSNNKFKTKQGIPRSYRLQIDGMTKSVLPQDKNSEPSRSWSRYQMAVTTYKDNETRSSSEYAMFDGMKPTVNFQNYLDDNENIVDMDLVAWVTLGVHHIPHTEDLPITPTVGAHRSFFLLPYNYFDEDPSMGSRNAIRFDMDNKGQLNIHRYGISNKHQCVGRQSKFDEIIKKDPGSVVQTKNDTFY